MALSKCSHILRFIGMRLNTVVEKIKALGPEFTGAKDLLSKLQEHPFKDRFILALEEELKTSASGSEYQLPSSLMHLGIDDSHWEEVARMIRREHLPPEFDFQKAFLSEDIDRCIELGLETSLFYEKAFPVIEDLFLIMEEAKNSPQALTFQLRESGVSADDAENIASALAIFSLQPIPDKIMYLSDKAIGAATLVKCYRNDFKVASDQLIRFLAA